MNYHFDYRRYRLAFRIPLWTAHGRWEAREGVIFRLRGEDGKVGYGEACPIPWFGTESIEEVEEACSQLGSATNDAVLDALPRELGCLCGGIESARMAWIEPEDPSARAVAAFLPAGRQALSLIEARAEIGFRTFKWKVGIGAVADEIALLDDICALLPPGGKLRLDANGAWDRRSAEKWLDRCADYPVEYVEQPCFSEAPEGAGHQQKTEDLLLGLAGDFPTPLALDESVVNARDVTRWLELGWPGYFVIKTSLMGEAEAALIQLEEANARVVFSSALETAIGAKSALKRAFLCSGSKHALGFGVWPLFDNLAVNGPPAAPFLRWEDIALINEEAAWNALS